MLSRRIVDGGDSYRNIHGLLISPYEEAVDWGDISKVASPGDNDMFFGNDKIIGRIEIDPAEWASKHRDPGVRGIRTNEMSMFGGSIGAEIATNIT